MPDSRVERKEMTKPSKGIKTTEFYLMVLAYLLMVVNGTSHVDIPWDQVTMLLVATGVYTGARTTEKVMVKKGESND